MKKLLILVLVLATLALVGGCGDKQTNALQPVEDFVCNPPASVKNLVALGLPALEAALSVAFPGSAAAIALAQSIVTADTILGKTSLPCVSVTELNNLIAMLQSDSVKAAYAKSMKTRGVVTGLDVTPLAKWRDGKK